MSYKPLTFDRTGWLLTTWRTWAVMPAAVLLSLFIGSLIASDRLTLQETWLKLYAFVIVAGIWFVIGLILAVLAGAHPLSRALWLDFLLSAGIGALGPFLLDIGTRPRRAEPQPTTFGFSQSLKQSVEVHAVDGPAVGVHFIFDGSEWRLSSRGDPRRLVRGSVYRGRHNLWFAKLDSPP